MQYIAIFLDEYLNEIGKKKFDSTDNFITFKKGTFNIRLDAFLYRNSDYTYYAYIYPTDEKIFIDIKDKMEPVKYEKDKALLSARLIKLKEKLEHGDLKLIVGESIIGQLARIAVLGVKQNWFLILIIAVAVGIGAGGLGYSLGLSHAQSTISNITVTVTPTPIQTIRPYP